MYPLVRGSSERRSHTGARKCDFSAGDMPFIRFRAKYVLLAGLGAGPIAPCRA